MSRFHGEARTVTVLHSQCARSATGAIALVLMTKEFGALALPLNERAIEVLRRDLTEAEMQMARKPGSA